MVVTSTPIRRSGAAQLRTKNSNPPERVRQHARPLEPRCPSPAVTIERSNAPARSSAATALYQRNAQWQAKEISPAEAAQFQNSLEAFAIAHPLVHDSYLINSASPEGDLWRRSVDAFATSSAVPTHWGYRMS